MLAYVTLAVVSFLRTAELLTLLELSLGTDGARADGDLAADTAAEAHVQRVTALAIPELRAVALVVVCTGGGEARVGTRVYVRFDHGSETLLDQWRREARQLFLRRLGT